MINRILNFIDRDTNKEEEEKPVNIPELMKIDPAQNAKVNLMASDPINFYPEKKTEEKFNQYIEQQGIDAQLKKTSKPKNEMVMPLIYAQENDKEKPKPEESINAFSMNVPKPVIETDSNKKPKESKYEMPNTKPIIQDNFFEEEEFDIEKTRRKCSNCGAINVPHAKYCMICGKSFMEIERLDLPEIPETTQKICACGTPNDPLAKFCVSCGSNMV